MNETLTVDEIIGIHLGFKSHVLEVTTASGKELAPLKVWQYPNHWKGPDNHPWLPEFSSDLNAAHAMEEYLLADNAEYSQRDFYASKLGSITNNDNGRGWEPLSNDDCYPILHATAKQRAEAFIAVKEDIA